MSDRNACLNVDPASLTASRLAGRREQQRSHLGPTCDERGWDHIWQDNRLHGERICLTCKLTEPLP